MSPTDWRATAAQAWEACDDRPASYHKPCLI